MGITARALVARRGSFVLDVPTLAVPPGGIAVLGPNGAGKTTLLLALQGLIASDGLVERPQRAAAVFARPAVLRGTALWNVSIVAQSVGGIGATEARAQSREMLDAVGLSERCETDARALSTGERQRLALARALVCRPEALFLDEPFANVDADARPALRALVGSYRERGCAVIIATAFLADAVALSSQVVVLSGGRPTCTGDVGDVATLQDTYVRALVRESALPR